MTTMLLSFSRAMNTVRRSRGIAATLGVAGFSLFATSAAAQVAAVTDGGLNANDPNTTCANGDGSLYIVNGDDCDPSGVLTGADPDQFHFLQGIRFGSGASSTVLDRNGGATFGGGAIFNGGVQFNGQVRFTGFTTVNQLNSANIVNSGSLSTAGISDSGTLLQSGRANFTGAVTMDGFYANSGSIASLNVPLTATIGAVRAGSVEVSSNLTVAAGGTIDMGGNRIQNVGAPVEGTDAANKDYVDFAVTGVQDNVASLNTAVADHETRITAVETQNVQQGNRLTAVENTNTVQDNRLTTVENTNVVQDTRLTSVENVNTNQDSRLTAIDTVNTMQSNQISTLQDQVGDLHTAVGGLRRNIQQANGGIAAAVALGGTMVVPDSNVSMSFNLATYRGQQGFSGAVVGRVAPKVYINVGVGGSTVRGSTAGRVGISFGL